MGPKNYKLKSGCHNNQMQLEISHLIKHFMEGDSLYNNPEAVFTKLITGIFTLAKGILSTKGSPKMLNR
jgi:hypothetical protein